VLKYHESGKTRHALVGGTAICGASVFGMSPLNAAHRRELETTDSLTDHALDGITARSRVTVSDMST
jgi:hypothetical protein